jgi:hypothetical protein
MATVDRRSNRCPKCGHTYTSRTHQTKCLHKTAREYNHWRASHRGSTGTHYTPKRTAGEIFESQIAVNMDFYRDQQPAPAPQAGQEAM